MEFSEYLKSQQLTDATIKTYVYGFDKLYIMLGKEPHKVTETRIITVITKADSSLNTKKIMLVSAIKVFNQYEMPTTKLAKYMEDLKILIAKQTDAKLKELVLPSLSELKQHNKNQRLTNDYTGFIITELLLRYCLRNKDMVMLITTNKDDINGIDNFIYVANTYIRITINSYKTSGTYGPKLIICKLQSFVSVVKLFLDGAESRMLIPYDIGTNLSNFVMKHTYNKLSESIYFKVIAKSLASAGKVKQLKQAGIYRGTSLEEIISTYLQE